MPAMGGSSQYGAGQIASSPTYSQGTSGEEVRILQELLNRWGFPAGTPDGKYGPGTAAAVRGFQKFLGLEQSGVMTPQTIQRLQSTALYEGIRVHGTASPAQIASLPLGPPRVEAASLTAIQPPPPPAPAATPTGPTPPAGNAATPPPPGGGTPPPPPPGPRNPQTDAEVDKYIRDNYAESLWTLEIPELAAVLKASAREGYSPGRLRSELMATEWWRTTEGTARQWTEMQANDPKGAQAKVDLNKVTVRQMASKIGVPLSDEDITAIATEAAKFDWQGDSRFSAAIAGRAQFVQGAALGGDLGTYSQTVGTLAREYFVDMTDEETFNFAKQWAGGEIDEDNIRGVVREKAKAALPYLAEFIDNGGTARGFFGTHIQQIAQLLEMDPNEVDLMKDPRFTDIVHHRDASGKPTYKNISETRQQVKSSNDYWKTNNAQRESSDYMETLKQSFGIGGR